MLDPILESVRARLPGLIAERELWESRAAVVEPLHDFGASLTAPGLSVIAEVKRRSPSVGSIAPDLDPATLARAYEAGGAAAVSVLTEPDHFGGSLDDLAVVRSSCGLPVLRKDFVVHPTQIIQARAVGADAVLLIAAVLDDHDLAALIEVTHTAGLTALVETHDGEEIARACAAGARVVGVNNRDLTTFDVDLRTAEALRSLIPEGITCVAESGVTDAGAALRMFESGYDAILVGQAVAQATDPVGLLEELRGVGA